MTPAPGSPSTSDSPTTGPLDERAGRQAVVDTLRFLDERGLNVGTSGNVSVRSRSEEHTSELQSH